MPDTLFCFGYGFSARAVARRLKSDGWDVVATARSEESAQKILSDGGRVLRLDHGPVQPPEGASWLISAPPGKAGCPALLALKGQSDAASWIGYLSTTGVYGDLDGGWVFEETSVSPQNDRSRYRVEAEMAWRDLSNPAHVFRLAGIYGPGRSAIDRVRSGAAKRIIKPGQVFSRIHIDDIAGMIAASLERPNPGRVYNVCDDEAAPPQDVIAYAAELLGLPVPPDIPFDDAELSDMARSFYADCKRVSNARAKAELGWRLQFPDYRLGLQDCLARQ